MDHLLEYAHTNSIFWMKSLDRYQFTVECLEKHETHFSFLNVVSFWIVFFCIDTMLQLYINEKSIHYTLSQNAVSFSKMLTDWTITLAFLMTLNWIKPNDCKDLFGNTKKKHTKNVRQSSRKKDGASLKRVVIASEHL